MSLKISYAAISFRGLRRKVNEDNYYVAGHFLQADKGSTEENIHLLSGTVCKMQPVFAVFDGMGGESCGEMASYTAASRFEKAFYHQHSLRSMLFVRERVKTCIRLLNNNVCEYAADNNIRSMGTTVALLTFTDKNVIWGNVGDSRIYMFTDKITQLSIDHAQKGNLLRKGPLTQYLGIPEEEMILEPYIGTGSIKKGTRYLICSDGVTDMLRDKSLLDIVSEKGLGGEQNIENRLVKVVRTLYEEIMRYGAVDNATIVLCEAGV